jgi:hypothetical protein
VFRGLGDGTFAPRTTYATGDNTVSLAIGDLDHDGGLDIVSVDDVPANTASILLSRCAQ